MPRGMSIVEPNQTLVAFSVQGEGVVQSMGTFRCRTDPPYPELHPIVALFIKHKDLPVQIEQRIERLIPLLHLILSYHSLIIRSGGTDPICPSQPVQYSDRDAS